jgi:hypothetical protein
MRTFLAVILLLACVGCASSPQSPADQFAPIPYNLGYTLQEALAAQAAAHARLSEAASNLSRVAAAAIAVGFLAFLFGHLLAIPRWVAATTIALGTLTATTAPQLLEFFGSENAQHLMLATFGLLALAGVFSGGLWLYRTLFKPDAPQD